jgi:hypothetical protein
MIKAPLGILGVAAAVLLASSFANVSAQPAKAPAQPAKAAACVTLKDETACGARTDCYWVAAVTDSETGKEKRRAYCRLKRTTQKKK